MTTQKPLLDNSTAKQNELLKTIFQLVAAIALLIFAFYSFKQASDHPLFPKAEPTQVCIQSIDSKCVEW